MDRGNGAVNVHIKPRPCGCGAHRFRSDRRPASGSLRQIHLAETRPPMRSGPPMRGRRWPRRGCFRRRPDSRVMYSTMRRI